VAELRDCIDRARDARKTSTYDAESTNRFSLDAIVAEIYYLEVIQLRVQVLISDGSGLVTTSLGGPT